MSPGEQRTDGGHDGFPRVSGDEPPAIDLDRDERMFSPRERG